MRRAKRVSLAVEEFCKQWRNFIPLNGGDWVFLSRKQAERWQKTPSGRRKVGSNGKPFNVIAAEVPVSYVNWTGKNLEFAYVGKRVVDRTVT